MAQRRKKGRIVYPTIFLINVFDVKVISHKLCLIIKNTIIAVNLLYSTVNKKVNKWVG